MIHSHLSFLTFSFVESDSDSEVQTHGNRGQKLKKRARFTHQGQLAPPSGPEVYREASLQHPSFPIRRAHSHSI